MTQHDIMSSISVFDYAHNKLCDLYDSQNDLDGQAYNISSSTNITDGIKQLSFSIPYKYKTTKVSPSEDRYIGNYISFNNTSGKTEIENIKTTIDPKQDIGEMDPYPGGSGKNKFSCLATVAATYNASVTQYDESLVVKSSTQGPGGYVSIYVRNLEAGTYTISFYGEESYQYPITPTATVYNANRTSILADNVTTTHPRTFTVSTAGDIQVVFKASGSYYQSVITTTYRQIQIEKGTSKTDYMPYKHVCAITGEDGCEISICGENLLSDESYRSGSTMLYVGKSTSAGYAVYLVPGTYTFTTSCLKAASARLIQKGSGMARIIISSGGEAGIRSGTFDIDTANYYNIFLYDDTGIADYVDWWQLKKDDTSTNYSEYEGNKYTRSYLSYAPVYGGSFDFITGQLVITRKSVTYDSLDWTYATNGSGMRYVYATIDDKVYTSAGNTGYELVCSSLAYGGSMAPSDFSEELHCYQYGKEIYIVDTSCDSNLTAFNQRYNGTQFVYYVTEKEVHTLEPISYELLIGVNNIISGYNLSVNIKGISEDVSSKVQKNFRWDYLKSEYLIRFIYNGQIEWFIAQKPSKHKGKDGIYGDVTCAGLEASLKTKNIYKEFDDTNGIGTISYLVDQILAGTGWHRGYTDTLYEKDGTTEKVRSLSSNNKQGALGLMTTVCNLFRCYPIYKTDTKEVEIYSFNNRDMVLEGTIGINMEALDVSYDSSDIITRLYVEGEYGEDGYIGIDSVNPTGLNYIMNFDYYREIGVFTQDHENALTNYLINMRNIKTQISSASSSRLEIEDQINALIGQCDLVVYYVASGYTTPVYVYGDPTAEQQTLAVGDEVVVLKNNGTYRYATIETTPGALIQTGEYGIAKFVTKAAGSIGAGEVQVEAKQKEIANLQRKISSTTKADKIAEYNAEITRLNGEITTIYTQTGGLYNQMHSLMKSDGLLYELDTYNDTINNLISVQDDVESDFIIAMGDMLRDGYWNDQNYIQGQEQHLYDDAEERLKIMSRPSVAYSFSLIRLHNDFGVPIEDFKLNALFRIHDDELSVHDNLFITNITIGVDDESDGSISVSNQDITINTNDLGSLLSRMSQLSDIIEQKNTLYDRAKAISKSGSIFADRLNGQIDVVKNQILSSVSNWYTDDSGNMVFLSADGGSAMMLSGAGFMLANSKDNDGNWNWRSFGTGEGFTADEMVAGFISADRIEAGTISVDKVTPGFGGSLSLVGNPEFNNYYGKQSGVTIDANGVTITGSKYLTIESGGSIDVNADNFVIDSVNRIVRSGGWRLHRYGVEYIDPYYEEEYNINTGFLLTGGAEGQSDYVLQNIGSKTLIIANPSDGGNYHHLFLGYKNTNGSSNTFSAFQIDTRTDTISLGTKYDPISYGYFSDLSVPSIHVTHDYIASSGTTKTYSLPSGGAYMMYVSRLNTTDANMQGMYLIQAYSTGNSCVRPIASSTALTSCSATGLLIDIKTSSAYVDIEIYKVVAW